MIEELIIKYKYLVVLIGAAIEGEMIILIASLYASKGILNIYIVWLLVFSMSVTVDQTCFLIGKKYGYKILNRYQNKLSRVISFAKRHAAIYTLLFRFIPGTRTLSPFILGAIDFHVFNFTILNSISAFLWSIILCTGGYYLGDKVNQSQLLFIAFGAIICVLLIKSIILIILRRFYGTDSKI